MCSVNAKGRSILAASLAFAFLALVPVVAATMLVDDNFNGLATGAKPADYAIEETGGSVTVAEVPSATDKSLFLNDPGSTVIKIAKKFAPQTGLVTVEISFMQPIFGSTAKVVRLLDQEGVNVAAHIETRKEGNIFGYKNADGTFTTLMPYNEKVWYNVKVVADVAAQKADVYVDGQLKLGKAAFLAAVKDIGAIDSYTPGSSNKGHYVDNIKVYAGT